MWALRAAALLTVVWGLVPGVLAWSILAEPFAAGVWPQLALRAVAAAVAALALLRGGRAARWSVLVVAALFAAFGLMLLFGGPTIGLWAWVDSPRAVIAATTATTALAAAILVLLASPYADRAATDEPPPRAWLGTALLAAVLGAAVAGGAWTALARAPVLIVDDADLLTPEQERRIARFHRLLRYDHDIDYRLITGRDFGGIDRYAARRFAELQVGRASDGGHGLLLVIDAAADTLRIEVSRSLEPVYVDAFVAYIEQRQMTEFFADARVADGVLATTELLVTRAQRAADGLAVNEALRLDGSAGGGARATARLDDDTPDSRSDAPARVSADTPAAVLAAYRQAMAARNDNPDLAFYSRATRRMLADWTVTPAQMDSVAESLRTCPMEEVRVDAGRAVLRAPLDERQCPPYFFVREKGRWRLDLEPLGRAIRFGRNNAWRVDLSNLADYRFGFSDWRFDGNGYPIARR